MFDVGFWELVMVGLVALVVIGPERLPGIARTAGLWIGKLRGYVNTMKADIDRELKQDELRRILEQQAKTNPLEEIMTEARSSVQELQDGLSKVNQPVDKEPK